MRDKYLFSIFLIIFLHIVEHVLNVFVIFKFFKKFFNSSSLLSINFFKFMRNTFKFGTDDFKAVAFKILLNISKFFKSTLKHNFFLIRNDFIYTVVDKFKFKVFK